jgi:signal transduction histidine kinase
MQAGVQAARSPARVFLIVLASATAIGLATGAQIFFTSLAFGRTFPLPRAFAMGLRDWYIWAAFLPLIWAAVRRYPMERPHLAKDAFMHLVFAAGLAVAYEFMVHFTSELWPAMLGWGGRRGDWEAPLHERLWGMLNRRFIFDGFIYGAIALAGRLRSLYQRMHEREAAELELRASLAEARMQSLKMQLQPHFLFNTLNAISTLIHTKPAVADDLLGELSDLLRSSLYAPEKHSLAAELDFLDRYLAIQQVRFGDRLKVRRAISSDTLDVEVPAMILQPIVENALRHGIEPRIGDGELELSARRTDAKLELTVRDNGERGAAKWEDGIGLKNTRARLHQHFGGQNLLQIVTNGSGTTVQILLPIGAGGGNLHGEKT